MRIAGNNWATIAKQLGYRNHSGAIHAVKAAIQKALQEPVNELRGLTMERLTYILNILWPRVKEGNLEAIDRAIRTIGAMRGLMGLDAPEQHEFGGPGGGPIPFEHIGSPALAEGMTVEDVDAAVAYAEWLVQQRSNDG